MMGNFLVNSVYGETLVILAKGGNYKTIFLGLADKGKVIYYLPFRP